MQLTTHTLQTVLGCQGYSYRTISKLHTLIENANAGRAHIRATILPWNAQSATIAYENHK